jgi:very-short-patch-repair endonuclease
MALRPRTNRARRLRREASEAERVLWRELKKMCLPVKIRRQHPIGRYIADFAIPAYKLAIEIDGGQHAASIEADARRTRAFNARGYHLIRFWNNEVLRNLEGVLKTIVAELTKSPTSP